MDYIILAILTLLSFVVFAKQVQKDKRAKTYWKYALLPIILYAVTYGFRKGWCVDYELYDALFTNSASNVELDQYEPLFRLIVLFLHFLCNSSAALFCLIASVFIFSILFLLRDKRDLLPYALPIVFFFSAYQTANLARYFLAMSFVYVGIEYLLKKRYWAFAAASLIGFYIHYSMAILILILVVIFFWGGFKKTWLNIILYLLTAGISISTIQETFVTPLFQALSFVNFGDNQLAKYADKEAIQKVLLGNRWGDVERSLYNYVFNFLYAIIYLFFGNKKIPASKYGRNFEYYYQLGALGLILQNIAVNAEILSRISLFFVYPSLLVSACMVKRPKQYFGNVIVWGLFVLSIAYIGISNIKGLYEQYDIEYIWDQR